MKFNLFKNKRQEKDVKSLPVSTMTKTVTKELYLDSINILYRSDKRFRANIAYSEYDDNSGLQEDIELIGEDWPDLLDKVNEHFGVDTQVDELKDDQELQTQARMEEAHWWMSHIVPSVRGEQHVDNINKHMNEISSNVNHHVHIPSNIQITSKPAQQKCSICGEIYYE